MKAKLHPGRRQSKQRKLGPRRPCQPNGAAPTRGSGPGLRTIYPLPPSGRSAEHCSPKCEGSNHGDAKSTRFEPGRCPASSGPLPQIEKANPTLLTQTGFIRFRPLLLLHGRELVFSAPSAQFLAPCIPIAESRAGKGQTNLGGRFGPWASRQSLPPSLHDRRGAGNVIASERSSGQAHSRGAEVCRSMWAPGLAGR